MTNDERPEKLASPDCEELTPEQVTFANWVGWQLAKMWSESERVGQMTKPDSHPRDALSEAE